MTLYDEFCHHVGGRGFTNREYSDWLELQVEKLRAALEKQGALQNTVEAANTTTPAQDQAANPSRPYACLKPRSPGI